MHMNSDQATLDWQLLWPNRFARRFKPDGACANGTLAAMQPRVYGTLITVIITTMRCLAADMAACTKITSHPERHRQGYTA